MKKPILLLLAFFTSCQSPSTTDFLSRGQQSFGFNETCWNSEASDYRIKFSSIGKSGNDFSVQFKLNNNREWGMASVSARVDSNVRRIFFDTLQGIWTEDFYFEPNKSDKVIFTLHEVKENKSLPADFKVGRQMTLVKMECASF